MKSWNKEVFGNTDTKIRSFEEVLKKVSLPLESNGSDEAFVARRFALISQLEMWHKKKSDYWKQMARDKYAKGLDRNSKYFHSVANFKKRKKQLVELKVDGRSIKETARIKKEGKRLFKQQFQ